MTVGKTYLQRALERGHENGEEKESSSAEEGAVVILKVIENTTNDES